MGLGPESDNFDPSTDEVLVRLPSFKLFKLDAVKGNPVELTGAGEFGSGSISLTVLLRLLVPENRPAKELCFSKPKPEGVFLMGVGAGEPLSENIFVKFKKINP
jgi:hypothetical protein